MKPIKPFLTYDQQIVHLQVKKKLIINDEESAKSFLSNISYYALIGEPKKQPRKHLNKQLFHGY